MKVRTTIRRSEGQERILVVDDEPIMVTRFKELLDKQSYEVESALSADEELNRLQGKWFGLIISDLGLSTMDSLLRVMICRVA